MYSSRPHAAAAVEQAKARLAEPPSP